jgi:glutathione synthase/RimK-type ligase-like ATP-grasp enzyme
MSSIAFLTYSKFPDLTPDDRIAVCELELHGARVSPVVWNGTHPSELTQYDLVVVRSIWDYHEQGERFNAWLNEIESLGITLLNPPKLVRWNSTKKYLRDISARWGIPTIPTEWFAAGDKDILEKMEQLPWSDIVIKPEISATADLTFRIKRENIADLTKEIAKIQARCDVMVQPYCESIGQGEYSIMFFHGLREFEYSHAILKVPKRGDFRVQEEWGGSIGPVEPPAEVLEFTKNITSKIPKPWLYVRVDVISYEGSLCLAELELIEPHLYFGLNALAAKRFSNALLSYL